MRLQVVTLPLLLILISCNTTEPPPGPPAPKDPRTYAWSIDTLSYPGSFQTLMSDIWGTSPTDLYVVGHNDLNRGKMYHYDGNQWDVIPLTWSEGGPIQEAIDLEAIYGFGPDDIYAAGERLYLDPFTQEFSDSSLLIHYNGSGWSEVNLPFGGRNLRDVWGTSPGNVWTSGWSGTLYHQEGIVWSRDSVRVSVAPGGFFQLYGIAGVGSTAYLLGNTIFSSSGTIIYYFFRRPANTWVLVDSFVIGGNQLVRKWGGAGLWTSPEGTLLSFGYGLFRWESPSWNSVFSSSLPFRGMAGTSEENIFLVGDFGKIYHYNGTDWYQFADLEFFNVVYEAVWMGKKQAFIVGNTGGAPQKTIILHGQ